MAPSLTAGDRLPVFTRSTTGAHNRMSAGTYNIDCGRAVAFRFAATQSHRTVSCLTVEYVPPIKLGLEIETVTPGTTAPCASVIVPVSVEQRDHRGNVAGIVLEIAVRRDDG